MRQSLAARTTDTPSTPRPVSFQRPAPPPPAHSPRAMCAVSTSKTVVGRGRAAPYTPWARPSPSSPYTGLCGCGAWRREAHYVMRTEVVEELHRALRHPLPGFADYHATQGAGGRGARGAAYLRANANQASKLVQIMSKQQPLRINRAAPIINAPPRAPTTPATRWSPRRLPTANPTVTPTANPSKLPTKLPIKPAPELIGSPAIALLVTTTVVLVFGGTMLGCLQSKVEPQPSGKFLAMECIDVVLDTVAYDIVLTSGVGNLSFSNDPHNVIATTL